MNIKDIYLFVNSTLKDVSKVIFPTYCSACTGILTRFDDEICTKCRHNLPFIQSSIRYNIFENQLVSKYKFVQKTFFLFNYQKNSHIQHLIHNFKYKKPQKLGVLLGKWHVPSLLKEQFIDKIDLIIPVPLHQTKLKKRGYNQLEHYAKTLAKELNAEFSSKVLIKLKDTKTQSKQNREARFNNMKGSIGLSAKVPVENKHILLVDDIVTTGATVETCLEVFKGIPNIKVSIAALGITLFD